MALKIGLHITGTEKLFGGKVQGVVRAAQLADEAGLDLVTIGEHLAIDPRGLADYPFGAYPLPLDAQFFEPIALLSAIAASTRRIRLATSILIAPLRSGLLLAKSLATLDALSEGRLEAGFGIGWHREEYAAAGIDFETRRAMLFEQIALCRRLWNGGEASFAGKFVQFDGLHFHPRPPQGEALPIWLGIAPAPRNAEQVARLADGWTAPPCSLDDLRASIATLRTACAAAGRDPASLGIRAFLPPVRREDGSVDLPASLAAIPGLRAAGADTLVASVPAFCARAEDIPVLIGALASAR